MWLCLNDTFLSVVDKDCAADELLVRSRRDGDIERVFPDAKVRIEPGHDYRCRVCVKRTEIVAALSARVMAINYPNFKSSSKDRALHDAYMRVWQIMGRLQPGGPYSTSRGPRKR